MGKGTRRVSGDGPAAAGYPLPMNSIKSIGIIGAGQMGGGIAQVAAVAGIKALVFDTFAGALGRCQDTHQKRLVREVEKGKMTQEQVAHALGNLHYIESLDMLKGADIVVEAIVEDASIKKELFGKLAKMFTGNQIL